MDFSQDLKARIFCLHDVLEGMASSFDNLCDAVSETFVRGGKIFLCGNGGSAAQAQHIAAEFVNRFKIERAPLPAIALTTDTSSLTAIANDYDFEWIFFRQMDALAHKGDMLIAISTSGNSPNILRITSAAKQRGIFVVGLTGKDGGELKRNCFVCLQVPSIETPIIQEIHLILLHMLCEYVDEAVQEGIIKVPNRGGGKIV